MTWNYNKPFEQYFRDLEYEIHKPIVDKLKEINMTIDNSVVLVTDRVWTVLNEGKKLHPRVDRVKMKEEIITAVSAALKPSDNNVDVQA